MMRRIVLLSVALPLLACATPGTSAVAPDPIPLGEGTLQLEIVRYAGRMNALAWIDEESNLLFRLRLDRETFALPVLFTKAEDLYQEFLERTGSEEKAAALLAENRGLIDEDYRFDVTSSFEAFWKTGPFTTPEQASHLLDLKDRLRSPGEHQIRIALEPDTVSWAISLRLVRRSSTGVEVLWMQDLDATMAVTTEGGRILVPPIVILTPARG